MKQTTGDIWTSEDDVIVIPTNPIVNKKGQLVMGRGLAKQAADRYPFITMAWAHNPLEPDIYIAPDGRELYKFHVKYHWRAPAEISIIQTSLLEMLAWYGMRRMKKLSAIVSPRYYQDVTISLPMVGCGNGKLDPKEVVPLLRRKLDDRFTLWIHPDAGTR